MNSRLGVSVALVCVSAGLLAGCSSDTVSGTPTSSSAATATGAASTTAGSEEAPKVQNPLPASVLDGSPCDSALTTEQLTTFIGTHSTERDDTFETGPACNWDNSSGAGGGISVYYATKVDGGLSLDYQNTKPQSSRWEPTEIQGYPAVAYTGKNDDQSITGTCVISVGIRDDLTFGVGLSLSNSARKRGVDSCEGVKEVADAVLTNLKARAR